MESCSPSGLFLLVSMYTQSIPIVPTVRQISSEWGTQVGPGAGGGREREKGEGREGEGKGREGGREGGYASDLMCVMNNSVGSCL